MQKSEGKCFEIIEHFGTIDTNRKNMNLELNKVSWYGKEPVYDIRYWNFEHTIQEKAACLSIEALKKLSKIIKGLDQ